MWLGNVGVVIDAALALVVILGLYWWSRRDAVTHANAMSDVAESGMAVDLPDSPPPTRRELRVAQAQAKAKAKAEARAAKKVVGTDSAGHADSKEGEQ